MNWFNNLSIKYKIGAIALIGVIALVVSLAVNYRLVSNVNVLLGRTIESQMPTLQFINELQVGFAEIKELYQAAIITSDDSSLQAANNNVRLLLSQFYEAKSKKCVSRGKAGVADRFAEELHRCYRQTNRAGNCWRGYYVP